MLKRFKMWEGVGPLLFTADGTNNGIVTVVSTVGFYVGMNVIVKSTNITLADKQLQVKNVISDTQMQLGAQDTTNRWSALDFYTVADGSTVEAHGQEFNVDNLNGQVLPAVYENHPIAALRTIGVDNLGRPWSVDNPLPVDAQVTVVVPPVTVDIDALTPNTRPDPDNILIAGSEDGTKGGLKHAVRVDSELDLRVGISDGANKASVDGSGQLAVSDLPALTVLQDIEAGIPESLGPTTMANSMPVTIATDQAPIPVSAVFPDEPLKISGTINGQPNGTEYPFVNNLRKQILATHDRVATFTYADPGTVNQRITRIDYTSATIPGFIIRRDFTYVLNGTRYIRDDETWNVI